MVKKRVFLSLLMLIALLSIPACGAIPMPLAQTLPTSMTASPVLKIATQTNTPIPPTETIPPSTSTPTQTQTPSPEPSPTKPPEAGTQVFVRYFSIIDNKIVNDPPDYLKQLTSTAFTTEQWQQAQNESGFSWDQVLTINNGNPEINAIGVPAVIVGEIQDQLYPNKGYIIFATPVFNGSNEITGTNFYIADINFNQSSYKTFYQLNDSSILTNWSDTSQIVESEFLKATTLIATSDGNLYKYIANNQKVGKPVLIFFPENINDSPILDAFLKHKAFDTTEILEDLTFASPPPTVLFLK